MGSWSELDAIYPPLALTPATVLVVALGHVAGATSIYNDGQLASFLPAGLGYDAELCARAEHYLATVPRARFLEESRALLSPRQRLIVALRLHERQLAAGNPSTSHPLVAQICAGLGVSPGDLAPHRATLALLHDHDSFAQ
ncbi:MAG: hypothetical protein EI684_02605 [Candidatus Viridilinea halotolerans]|uniref:Co-chaperone DjlA N-terminal domain-containing protein n=1 Tax=Candidatus Viridilinea halotolerans TaxID=2491704 RepID=A0A426U8P0_9CHLR|nr:MAG: hypothetical protein EI684_02605 [Candidatus Viridilinea halotolerans]